MNDEPNLNDARLREIARRLGASAADRLDAGRTAAEVVRRLRQPPARAPWLRIAAAIVVLVGGGLAVREVLTRGADPQGTASLIAVDLTDLSAEDLREVLTLVEDSLSLEVESSDGSLDVLDAQQLRAVLTTLEG